MAAWRQFLLAKREMLAAFDRALVHAKTQAVVTHHGNVAEAEVRRWLTEFLPKRYGVTSGHVRSQGATPYQSSHFDVIVYDQLESPTLWIDENRDKSEGGRARIIPAEHVGAIIEVKAAFNRRAVSDAITKLHELDPLMTAVDGEGERYPKYLPADTVLALMFFDLRKDDSKDLGALDAIRTALFLRLFYGAVILRGEGRDQDDTARVQQVLADKPMDSLFIEAGLLHHAAIAGTGTEPIAGALRTALLMWGDWHFSAFAFDLLALLNGTYETGRVSSFHGFDFSAYRAKT